MNIVFYSNFYKRKNSTKRPSNGTTVSCTLKNDCSMLNPQIEIEYASATSNPVAWNYAYIDAFGRYYYVTDWQWVEHRKWKAFLSVDSLATHKEDIGASEQFVLRSSNVSNGNVVDYCYFQESRTTTERKSFQTPWAGLSNGSYVVCGNQTDGEPLDYVGSMTYVIFKKGGMQAMVDNITSDWRALLQKAINDYTVNPLDFIQGCIFIPLNPDTDLTTTDKANYKVQKYESKVHYLSVKGAYRFTKHKVFEITSDNLPAHPDADKYGLYLNGNIGTSITLFFPPFGVIPLNADLVRVSIGVYGELSVDITNGNCKLDIYAKNSDPTKDVLLESVSSNCGCNFSLNASMHSIGNVIGDVVTTSADIVDAGTMLAEFSGVEGMSTNISQKVTGFRPRYSYCGGSAGGLADIYGVPFVQYTYTRMSGIDVANIGLPICKVLNISAVGGYFKCATANVSTNATPQEIEEIRSYMLGGFYYE